MKIAIVSDISIDSVGCIASIESLLIDRLGAEVDTIFAEPSLTHDLSDLFFNVVYDLYVMSYSTDSAKEYIALLKSFSYSISNVVVYFNRDLIDIQDFYENEIKPICDSYCDVDSPMSDIIVRSSYNLIPTKTSSKKDSIEDFCDTSRNAFFELASDNEISGSAVASLTSRANISSVIIPNKKVVRENRKETVLGWLKKSLLPGLHKTKNVSAAIFAPLQVESDMDFLIQVSISDLKSLSDLEQNALMTDPTIRKRAYQSLGLALAKGQKVEVHLKFSGGAIIDEEIKVCVYDSMPINFQFIVSFDSNKKMVNNIGTCLLYIDGVLIGCMKFVIKVSSSNSLKMRLNAPTEVIPLKYYFISYSSKDYQKVKENVQLISVISPSDDVFLDKFFLNPGDRYESLIYDYIDNKADVFLLYWSENAKESEWVRKEYMRAIKKEDLHICPIIIEQPIPAPPAELSHIHFGNKYNQ